MTNIYWTTHEAIVQTKVNHKSDKMPSTELEPNVLVDNWTRVKKEKPKSIDVWRPIININRYLGIVQLQPIDEEPYFKYRWFSCWLINSSVIVFIQSCSLTLTILSFRNQFTDVMTSAELVELVIQLIFLLHSQFTVVFFLSRGKRLVDLFQNWIETEHSLNNKHINQPVGQSYQCYNFLLFILILTASIIHFLSSLTEVKSRISEIFIHSFIHSFIFRLGDIQ